MASPLDLNNVQGDILVGLPKKTEIFYFFRIKQNKNTQFRRKLAELLGSITTGKGSMNLRKKIHEHKDSHKPGLLPVSAVNIAFAAPGLRKMGVTVDNDDQLGDTAFNDGMFANAETVLGDKLDDLDPRFQQHIDGVILIAGDCHASVDKELAEIKKLFLIGRPDAIVVEVLVQRGDVRAKEPGHEPFGFQDCISQPAVTGVDPTPSEGLPSPVPLGAVLLGREGDQVSRPPWALDGSFLAFRLLPQRVPEFDKFLLDNPIPANEISEPGVSGSELLGARMVGRWKSGAPLDIVPTKDDPSLAFANNFDFRVPNPADEQVKCPFAAHVRKTNPRGDLIDALNDEHALDHRRIIRRGIPFGPEVTPQEAASHTTVRDRGLLFVAYQSNIENGFQFIQQSWANNVGFIFGKPTPPGFDPIVGQNPDDTPRSMSGMFTSDSAKPLDLGTPEFVVSKGGEYFFSPSMPTLKKFATVA